MITVRPLEATGDCVVFGLEGPDTEVIELTFRSESLVLRSHGDAALVAALPLAMSTGEALHVDLPVSSRLRSAVATIQDVLTVWWRSSMTPVAVTTGDLAPPAAGNRHGGVFSHDLGSVHLAIAPGAPALLFEVRGDGQSVDPPAPGQREGLDVVTTNLEAVGERFGLDWHAQYRGAALASAAHSVADLERVDLAAPFSVHYLFPWGSHGVLDPLWSGDGLNVRHRHADRDWVERLELVAREPKALDQVQACSRERAPAACGTCRGCLFLAAGLHVIDRSSDAVDLDALQLLDLRHYTALADTAVLLHHADRSRHADLVKAVEAAVRRLGPEEVRWPDNWFSYLAELGSARR